MTSVSVVGIISCYDLHFTRTTVNYRSGPLSDQWVSTLKSSRKVCIQDRLFTTSRPHLVFRA